MPYLDAEVLCIAFSTGPVDELSRVTMLPLSKHELSRL